MSMNAPDNNPQSGSRMRRLLTDGATVTPVPTAPPRQRRDFAGFFRRFWLPLVLVIILLIGTALVAYSFGMFRGRDIANADRDTFYVDRARAWSAEATAKAATTAVGATGANNATAYTAPGSIFGRVDRIEGGNLTVLLLDKAGNPIGTTLIAVVTPQTQIWQNIPATPAEMRPGDSILLSGERNESGNYEARTIVVLAAGP